MYVKISPGSIKKIWEKWFAPIMLIANLINLFWSKSLDITFLCPRSRPARLRKQRRSPTWRWRVSCRWHPGGIHVVAHGSFTSKNPANPVETTWFTHKKWCFSIVMLVYHPRMVQGQGLWVSGFQHPVERFLYTLSHQALPGQQWPGPTASLPADPRRTRTLPDKNDRWNSRYNVK